MVVLLFQPCIKKEEEYSNMSGYDWAEYVKDFKESYDGNEEYIPEYIDSLLPVYYSDIEQAFKIYLGTSPVTIEIEARDVGLKVWQVMNMHLYDEFMHIFMEEWNALKEDEEE